MLHLVRSMLSVYPNIENGLVAVDRILEYIDTLPQEGDHVKDSDRELSSAWPQRARIPHDAGKPIASSWKNGTTAS